MSTQAFTEIGFAEIVAQNGGRVFRVGGCVRDSLMGRTPREVAFSIVGMVKKNFKTLFPEAEDAGKPFPVFHLVIDGVKREVAFARTEQKAGSGLKAFKVSAKPKITIEEDLFRRDTRVNSMAMDCLTGELIDPFQGREDIETKVLRANGQHFTDYPMNALRIAGQAACLGFKIETDTLQLVIRAGEGLAHEPVGRMAAELELVLSEAPEPGRFFRVLAKTGLLPIVFKELSQLSREAFEKTMVGLDAVAQATTNPKVRFAALGAALNKEGVGLWSSRMKLPGSWLDAAVTVSQTIHLLEAATPAKLVDTIYNLRRGSLTIEEFDLITKAAGLKIPQLGLLKEQMALPQEEAVPKHLKGREIGEWLREKHIELLARQLHSKYQ